MHPTKHQSHRLSVALSLAVLLACSCPLSTRADTATWSSAISGNWTTTTNWLPNVVPNDGTPPGSSYDVLINATGSAYTVTLSTAATINSFTLNSPTATLLLSAQSSILSLTSPSIVQAGTIDLQPPSGTVQQAVLDLGNSTLTLSGASSSLLLTSGEVQNGVLVTGSGASIVAGPVGANFSDVTFENDPTISVKSIIGMVGISGNVTLSLDGPPGSNYAIVGTPFLSQPLGSNISVVTGSAGAVIDSGAFGGTVSAQTPNTDVQYNVSHFLSTALEQATNGATMHFFHPDENDGVIRVGTGSTIFFDSQIGKTFTNSGTLSADGGILIFLGYYSPAPEGSFTLGGAIYADNGGTLNFSSGVLTVTSPIALSNAYAIFNANAQSITTVTGTGFVSIGDGKSLTSDGITAASLQLGINSSQTIRPNGTPTGTSDISTLTLAGSPGNWSSLLDLANNALIIETTPASKAAVLATLQNQIAQAESNGTWTGTGGITSSTVAADSTHTLGLALADNAAFGYTTFAGQSVDANSLIITQAHIGDATLDGRIDIQDLNKVTSHWQQSGALWSDGDTTGPQGIPDGKVDIQDLNAVTSNWQFGTGNSLTADSAPLTTSSPVPEPASLALLAAATLPLLLRRRRGCITDWPGTEPVA